MATSRPDVLPQYNYVHAEQPVPSPEETESIFDPFEDEFPMRFVNFKQQFKILEPAGAASDSPVLRVHDNDMEMECALKVLSKRQILNRGWKSVEQTNQEARILRKLNHTFVVDFISSWQNSTKLFLAMEYLPGGELYHLWKKLRIASDSLIRFFAAQVAVALDYLHSKYIVHRDLKMENLMFDSGGYLKLIDFGASKEMNSHPFDRTWTICGTLAYCAPEMLNGNGYDYMVDWWALGIMCYALSCGAYPVAPGRDHRDMRESINRHRYVAPAHVSTNLEQIILKLLRKDPQRRTGGISMLSRLNFFAGLIDFYKVELRQYDPRAFYTGADIVKLPDGPLKRWILDYQTEPDKPEEFYIRGRGADISIVRSSTTQSKTAMPPQEERDQADQKNIGEWLLAQPELMGTDLTSFVQSGEVRGSIRSVTTTRASKHSFVQSGSITRGGMQFSSMHSSGRSDHEKNNFTQRIWRRSTRRSGAVGDGNEFILTSNSYERNGSAPAHKRTSIKSLWASFKERLSRATSKTNTTRSKSLANSERGRRRSSSGKVKIEPENSTGPVEMYVNVIRAPSHNSIKSTPERGFSKGHRDYECNGQTERVIYIKPR